MKKLLLGKGLRSHHPWQVSYIFVLLFNGIIVLQLGIQNVLLHVDLDCIFHLFENLVACHTAVDLNIGSALILAHLCAHVLLLKLQFSSVVLIYTYAGYPSYMMYIIYTNIQCNLYRSFGSSLISSLIISVSQVLHHVNGSFYSKPAFTINLRPPKTIQRSPAAPFFGGAFSSRTKIWCGGTVAIKKHPEIEPRFSDIFASHHTVDGRNPKQPAGMSKKPCTNNKINYQPQLVISGFLPSTVLPFRFFSH